MRPRCGIKGRWASQLWRPNFFRPANHHSTAPPPFLLSLVLLCLGGRALWLMLLITRRALKAVQNHHITGRELPTIRKSSTGPVQDAGSSRKEKQLQPRSSTRVQTATCSLPPQMVHMGKRLKAKGTFAPLASFEAVAALLNRIPLTPALRLWIL